MDNRSEGSDITGAPHHARPGGLLQDRGGEGIAEGYEDGTFQPSVAVSRQAMAAFLHRIASD
jgi:hypothetical protein